MSFANLDKMSEYELVASYVQDRKGCGAFLPYHENHYIELWLKAANNDALKVIDILGDIFDRLKAPERGTALKVSLKRIHPNVINHLQRQ